MDLVHERESIDPVYILIDLVPGPWRGSMLCTFLFMTALQSTTVQFIHRGAVASSLVLLPPNQVVRVQTLARNIDSVAFLGLQVVPLTLSSSSRT